MMRRGIGNLLRHLGMLPGEPDIPTPPRRLFGAGNTDDGLAAGADGFLILGVALLDRVTAGQPLGRLVDLQGNTLETYLAPRAGTIALTREMPVIAKGDTLFLIADEQ
jgi:predicted deacylase